MSEHAQETGERWVSVAGREVRVLQRGTGPAVVLVHGLGLSATVWEDHLVRLANAGYRALAPDLPGFGRSPGPYTGMSVQPAADWLRELADVLEVDRAAWIGHSVGTQPLVRLARDTPDRTAALVLAAPTGWTGFRTVRPLLGLLGTAFQEPPRFVAGVLRRYLAGPLVTAGTWTRSLRHDTVLDAPLVSCPTLLVSGGRDLVVPREFPASLERLIPDATLDRFEEASHAVALEVQPFMDRVIRFLDRRYGRGVSTDRWNSSSMAPKSHGSSGP